jgi:hypothetical protein
MATQVQLRRGTATENNSFTGAQGELTFDTTNKRVRVHDGSAAGGFELVTEDGSGNITTGTVTADGLTVENTSGSTVNINTNLVGADSKILLHEGSTASPANGASIRYAGAINEFSIGVGSSVDTKRLSIARDTGDISFYEDTGTTAKFFWDASAESLGIGTSSPNNMLTLEDGDLQIHETGSSDPLIQLSVGGTQASPTQSWVLRVDNSDSDKFQLLDQTDSRVVLTADGDGNVGIGTDSPSSFWSGGNQLVVGSGTGSQGLTIYSGTTSDAGIYFSDGTVGNALYQGQIFYRHNDDAMVFNTAATERMRIDSSGNLLVGTTDANPGNNSGGSDVGIVLDNNGKVLATANSAEVMVLNRQSSDGDIAEFRKDGSTVGSIRSVGTQIAYSAASEGLLGIGSFNYYRWNTSEFEPVTNNSRDLGSSTYKWKDLYLSGGVYLGGTGSANHLDDYEEGTWTPVLTGSGGNPTQSYNNQLGYYTKIGNMVHLTGWIYFGNSGISAGSGALRLGGLPFTITSALNARGALSISEQQSFSTAGNGAPTTGFLVFGNTIVDLQVYKNDAGKVSGTVPALASDVQNSTRMAFTCTYTTSA